MLEDGVEAIEEQLRVHPQDHDNHGQQDQPYFKACAGL
jgi:hypothetical protein